MEYIREKVSQNKIRYMKDGFNLDLTYITERLIAMSFPAEGFESVYRNPLPEVARFLKEKYNSKYLVVNISNRMYDFGKFDNNVYNIDWPDHHPCPFKLFIESSLDLSYYLLADPQNILAIHCLAGKGRTGSMICVLLFNSGLFTGIIDANQHYLSKRNVNVTNPSQLRYLFYYVTYFQNGSSFLNFNGREMTQILLKTTDRSFFLNRQFKITVEDFSKNLILFNSMFDGSHCMPYEDGYYIYPLNLSNYIDQDARDILVRLEVQGMLGFSVLFRVNFCLLFVKESSITFKPTDLDKGKHLPPDFSVTLKFKNIEKKNPASDELAFANFDTKIADLKKLQANPDFAKTFLGNLNTV